MEELQFVTFTLESEEYGIPINKVREIIKISEWNKVPRAPYFIKGVINLRGEIIPIIDLRILFKIKKTSSKDQYQIVIIEISGNRVGIMVEEVNEVIKLTAAAIEQLPDILKTDGSSFIMGMGKQDNRILILLNADEILSNDKEEFIRFQRDVVVDVTG
ncbi:MAG: chemotaxis protein CheW [Syntrophomonadaceae bacterium]|nr:chemotaxis protein CheW [Syntrophomonadaceae bacterium]